MKLINNSAGGTPEIEPTSTPLHNSVNMVAEVKFDPVPKGPPAVVADCKHQVLEGARDVNRIRRRMDGDDRVEI